MRIISSALVVAAVLCVASPALAQSTGTTSSRQRAAAPKPPAPPLPKPVMSIRAFGAVDFEWMTASESFDAVGPMIIGYGGGGEAVNVWKTLFIRGGYFVASGSGERLIDPDSGTTNGISMTVHLKTLEVGGGWRFRLRGMPKYTPYAGAGFIQTKYSDKSDLELPNENVTASVTGFTFFGGVDAQIAKKFNLLVEAQYRTLPLKEGDTAVPIVESDRQDLGGFVVRVMVAYQLWKR